MPSPRRPCSSPCHARRACSAPPIPARSGEDQAQRLEAVPAQRGFERAAADDGGQRLTDLDDALVLVEDEEQRMFVQCAQQRAQSYRVGHRRAALQDGKTRTIDMRRASSKGVETAWKRLEIPRAAPLQCSWSAA